MSLNKHVRRLVRRRRSGKRSAAMSRSTLMLTAQVRGRHLELRDSLSMAQGMRETEVDDPNEPPPGRRPHACKPDA